MPAAGEMAGELAPGDANKLNRIPDLEAKLARPAKGGIGVRPSVACRGHQRVAERDLQLELLPPTVAVVGDLAKQREAAVKLRHRFGGSAAGERDPRSLEPKANRSLGKPRLRQMMRQQLGPGIDDSRGSVARTFRQCGHAAPHA